jgi:hypothetical protein
LKEGSGKDFQQAVQEAKDANPHGAAVTVYSSDDYDHMRTFVSKDGKVGFALKDDDIISVFKHPDSDAKHAVASVMDLATSQGGKRLGCFDTALPHIYAQSGFKAVARTPWNDEYKPEGWDYDQFKGYNNGRPDVVFMTHDPAHAGYHAGDGKSYASYDEGIEAQKHHRYHKAFAKLAELQALVKDYNEGEERDEHGRWTSGGGRKSEAMIVNNKFTNGGEDTEVLKNPSRKDLNRFVSDYEHVRLMRGSDGNLYAWPAMADTHDHMATVLNLKAPSLGDTDLVGMERGKPVGQLGNFFGFPRARLAKTILMFKSFNPDQPRDEHGRWAGEGAVDRPDLGMTDEQIKPHIKKVCKDLGYDKDKVSIVRGDRPFQVAGKEYQTAGLAHLDSGKVEVYGDHVREDSVDGLMAHEIEHQKFQNALNQYNKDYDDILANPVADDYGDKYPALSPPYDEKYPAYSKMEEAYKRHSAEDFAETDGVSEYSEQYWKGYREGNVRHETAMHETLAEMSRIKYETGKFPEHTGPRLLSVRRKDMHGEFLPKPSAKKIREGTKRWRHLFRTINSLND